MAAMDGTVALVTGATGGLGQAVATGLAREGALVVVVGRSSARAEGAVKAIRPLVPAARLEPLACDLSVQSSSGLRQLSFCPAMTGWTCWSTPRVFSAKSAMSPPMGLS